MELHHANSKSQTPIRNQNSMQKWQNEKKLETQSVLMVPCLNCEELIPFDQVDLHSRSCYKVCKQVIEAHKSSSPFDEINFKLEKIKTSLRVAIENIKTNDIKNKGLTDQIERKFKFTCRALEICENLLDQCDLKKLNDLKEELQILCLNYQGSVGVQLYLQRLLSLVEQKINLQQVKINIQRYPSPSWALKAKITEKKLECDKMKAMTQTYQTQIYNSQKVLNSLLNIDNQSISKISNTSNIKRHQSPIIEKEQQQYMMRQTFISKFSSSNDRSQFGDQKSELLSQYSGSYKESDGQIDDYQKMVFQQNLRSLGGDHLQRLFYSKCLNLKMKLPGDHPSQKIPVSIIFKEAIIQKIAQEKWESFINNALQNPQQYLDLNKVQNGNGIVRNNLREKSKDNQFRYKIQNL